MQIINESGLPIVWIPGKVTLSGWTATCVVKGTFRLVPDSRAEPAEEQEPPGGDLYIDKDVEKSCIYESDFAPFKPRTDLLLSGRCFTPGGQPASGCRVTFQAGECKKSLYVFGDRQWKKSLSAAYVPSDPVPFTKMDLRYENSFGGPQNKNNPHGKGEQGFIDKHGHERWPLPNIEDPALLITSRNNRPLPAGFGPLGRMWPCRTEGKMGTYDDAWLKERWPYFPVDFDWSYFNCAPPDQQLANYLSGDEMLYFENLHPERAHLHCQLPGIRVRVFVNNEAGGRVHFSEVNLNIDTLWVAPEVGRLHLIWRGLIEVQDEKMEEVAHCLVVSEQLDQPSKTVEDYRHVLSARLEGEFEDSDTTPPVMEVEAVDDSWIKGMEEEFVRLEKEMAAIDKKADASGKKLQAILAGEGSRPSGETPSSPPSFDEAMNNSSEFERQLLESHPELAKLLPKKMAPAAAAGIDDVMAFDDSPADADTELFPVPMTRDECRMRTETSKDFEGEDLFGLDLSELDFSDCNCRGANFEAAILAGAAFSRADLTGARFPGCSLVAVDFSGAKLVEADCTAADLTSAKLDSAVVDNSDFSYAVMEYASLVGTSGFRAIFVNANLNGATLVNARMVEADFEAASLVAADFTEADLTGTSVEGAQGPQVKMISANLTGLQASEGADFSNGLFRSVHAPESIWEGAVLEGADFSAADLARADFAQSSLKKARFSGSDLTMARFEDADLTEAVMTGVNFFQGSLEQAKLNRTDLRSSNCYEVEFYRAEIVDAQFGGAVLTMTKLAGGKER